MSEKSRPPGRPDSGEPGKSVRPGEADEVVKTMARGIGQAEPNPNVPEDDVVDQHGERRLLTAQIKEKQAATLWLKTGSRDRKARTDAEGERISAEIANETRLAEARIENESKLTDAQAEDLTKRRDAKIKDREAWTRADIADRERRTEAEVQVVEAGAAGIELRNRTWQVTQYFWMGVMAFGLIFSVILALVTADATMLEYRLSPLAGLAIFAGGGFQLHVLNRSEDSDD